MKWSRRRSRARPRRAVGALVHRRLREKEMHIRVRVLTGPAHVSEREKRGESVRAFSSKRRTATDAYTEPAYGPNVLEFEEGRKRARETKSRDINGSNTNRIFRVLNFEKAADGRMAMRNEKRSGLAQMILKGPPRSDSSCPNGLEGERGALEEDGRRRLQSRMARGSSNGKLRAESAKGGTHNEQRGWEQWVGFVGREKGARRKRR